MVGIGMSRLVDSFRAGQDAARQASAGRPQPTWALGFAGGRHGPSELLEGVRAELGDIPVYGGTGVGTITNQELSYDGYEFAVAVFDDSLPPPECVCLDGLDRGERAFGVRLGREIGARGAAGNTVLLFYDSIASSPPPVLHVGSRLVDGVYEGLEDTSVVLIGGGTVGDLQLSSSYILNGRKSLKHAAVALILPERLQSHVTIMHGCVPVSAFLEITRIDGPVVYGLDGRPALDVLLEMTGLSQDAALRGDIAFIVTLGEWHGEPGSECDESAYVNRLIIRCDPEERSITLFEADFREGDLVQIMSRDNQAMLDSVARQTRDQLARLAGLDPLFALYIDCAGRTSAWSGAEVEEAAVLQRELAGQVPLLGFYSGVEIAPLFGRSRPLDWTGVLTMFTRR